MSRELIMVGDKVLIEPAEPDAKTSTGLYLPQGVKEKEKAHMGKVVKTGPGYPVPDPSVMEEEPWLRKSSEKYFPLQAKEGDYCIFLREQGVEIEYEGTRYIVVPHSAILVLIRDSFSESLEDI